MSYEEIRDYLRILLRQAADNPEKVQIDGTVIDPYRIRAVEHSKLAGLQVADAIASRFHFAVKMNRYGETEAAYLPHLKKGIYRHKGAVLGYGLKVWLEDLAAVRLKAPEVMNLEGLSNRRPQEPRIPPKRAATRESGLYISCACLPRGSINLSVSSIQEFGRFRERGDGDGRHDALTFRVMWMGAGASFADARGGAT